MSLVTFTPNTAIKSADVNANFTGLANGTLITTPYNNPYKFLAYHNTTQSLATGAIIGFNTELYDTGNNYDGTNKFTAPVAGYYNIYSQLYYNTVNAAVVSFYFNKNGSTYVRGTDVNSGGNNQISVGSNICLFLAANDTVQVSALFSGGGSTVFYGETPGSLFTLFGGFLVSIA